MHNIISDLTDIIEILAKTSSIDGKAKLFPTIWFFQQSHVLAKC